MCERRGDMVLGGVISPGQSREGGQWEGGMRPAGRAAMPRASAHHDVSQQAAGPSEPGRVVCSTRNPSASSRMPAIRVDGPIRASLSRLASAPRQAALHRQAFDGLDASRGESLAWHMSHGGCLAFSQRYGRFCARPSPSSTSHHHTTHARRQERSGRCWRGQERRRSLHVCRGRCTRLANHG